MTKNKRERRRKSPPEPEHTLLAAVKSVTASYYVGKNGDGVADEAITDVLCDIVAMTPNMTKHSGMEVTCSLMCSRQYGRIDDPDEKGWLRIGKGQRAGPGCLNRISASISGASAGVRPPSGMAAG